MYSLPHELQLYILLLTGEYIFMTLRVCKAWCNLIKGRPITGRGTVHLNDLAEAAAEGSLYPILELLAVEEWTFDPRITIIPGKQGNVELLEWFRCKDVEITEGVVAAAGAGHVHVLKWLQPTTATPGVERLAIEAVRYNRIEVLRYLVVECDNAPSLLMQVQCLQGDLTISSTINSSISRY